MHVEHAASGELLVVVNIDGCAQVPVVLGPTEQSNSGRLLRRIPESQHESLERTKFFRLRR